MGLADELTAKGSRQYTFKIGTAIASALFGFVAGVVSSAIIFYTLFQTLGNT